MAGLIHLDSKICFQDMLYICYNTTLHMWQLHDNNISSFPKGCKYVYYESSASLQKVTFFSVLIICRFRQICVYVWGSDIFSTHCLSCRPMWIMPFLFDSAFITTSVGIGLISCYSLDLDLISFMAYMTACNRLLRVLPSLLFVITFSPLLLTQRGWSPLLPSCIILFKKYSRRTDFQGRAYAHIT